VHGRRSHLLQLSAAIAGQLLNPHFCYSTVMPSSRNALKQLLETIERHIAEAEAELLTTLTPDEVRRIIDQIAKLELKRQDIRAVLTEGEPTPL
jgi:hypothetical protein